MSSELVSDRLRSLVLSAVNLRQMRVQENGFFPEEFISDYLNFIENFVIIAEAIDGEILQDLEEINTEFQNYSIPFVFGNLLREDNPDFTWNSISKLLNVNGIITSEGRERNRTEVASSPYNVVNSDEDLYCDTDIGIIVLNLLPGIGAGNIKIINTGSSNNNVNITPNSTELFGGKNAVFPLYDSENIEVGYKEPDGWW